MSEVCSLKIVVWRLDSSVYELDSGVGGLESRF